jgi:hypothetical protein
MAQNIIVCRGCCGSGQITLVSSVLNSFDGYVYSPGIYLCGGCDGTGYAVIPEPSADELQGTLQPSQTPTVTESPSGTVRA